MSSHAHEGRQRFRRLLVDEHGAPSLCRTRQQYAPSLTLCIRCLPSRRCNRCYLEWRWSKFAGKDPARSLDLGGLMGDEPDRKSATAACTIPREGESASIGNGKSEAPLLPEQFEEAIDKLSFSFPKEDSAAIIELYRQNFWAQVNSQAELFSSLSLSFVHSLGAPPLSPPLVSCPSYIGSTSPTLAGATPTRLSSQRSSREVRCQSYHSSTSTGTRSGRPAWWR